MNLKIENENYSASVVVLHQIFDIEGADFIKKTIVNGNTVIVSKDAKVGDKMIYFISGTALSPEICYNNNLYGTAELNKDNTRGYVSSKQRRVRAIKLKGVISDGLLLPMTALSYLGVDGNELNEGDSFTHVNDVEVCYKYEPPQKTQGQGSSLKEKQPKLKDFLIPGQLRFHHETAHLGRNLHKLHLEDEIVITDKLHGSSMILANVLVKRNLSWIESIVIKWLGVQVVEEEYTGIYSSGKPKSGLPKGIVSKWLNNNKGFYSNDIWKTCYNDFEYAAQKGITIYGEIVGPHVQGGFDYSKLHNRDGYGFLVYRITRTNVDGKVDEFTWRQVEDYCEQYQLQTVPLVFRGTLKDWVEAYFDTNSLQDIDNQDEFLNALYEKMKEMYLEKNCPYCLNKVPAEGVCIRKERPYDVFKLKSDSFKLLENKCQEDGLFDVEEAS